ncbi:MAG: hypothetical protein ACOYNO_12310 [Saprospiraceae bacterium]
MFFNRLFFMLGCFSLGLTTQGQQIIHLKNPSFELNKESKSGEAPVYWVDMGSEFESPPDIQPGKFDVRNPAAHGSYYVGMVVRDNRTTESIGQTLEGKLFKDSLYTFSVSLARSNLYISLSRLTGQQAFFSEACVLQVIGINTQNQQSELLAESTPVEHTDWKNYVFQLRPQMDSYDYLQLKVFYVDGTDLPYNGNILIDNLSPIIQETP